MMIVKLCLMEIFDFKHNKYSYLVKYIDFLLRHQKNFCLKTIWGLLLQKKKLQKSPIKVTLKKVK